MNSEGQLLVTWPDANGKPKRQFVGQTFDETGLAWLKATEARRPRRNAKRLALATKSEPVSCEF